MLLDERAKKEIARCKNFLEGKEYICTEPIKRSYNYEFYAEKNGIKNKILIYFGKKGLKTVVQGDTNSKEYSELAETVGDNYSLDLKQNSEQDFEDYIGTDETGKGDYFGPLVVAGFFFHKKFENELRKLGVRDSKELSDTKINDIAPKIIGRYINSYSVVMINPPKYNELYEKFRNINEILNWAHSKAVENLSKTDLPTAVITDKFSNKALNISYSNQLADTEFIQIPRAENYLGVATASILARYSMNKWFIKMEQEGIKLPKGASKEVKKTAESIVNKHGQDSLRSYAKIHFKVTEQVLNGNS